MKKLLWLDDLRDPFEDNWIIDYSPLAPPCEIHWVKSYSSFTTWILENGLPDGICFDHDLGSDIRIELVKSGISKRQSRKMKQEMNLPSGYDCAKWLVEYCLDRELPTPLYNIQSANPSGKENIDMLLKNYKKHYGQRKT